LQQAVFLKKINTQEFNMGITRNFLIGSSILAGVLLNTATCFAYGSFGSTVNTYCQTNQGVQPYTGDCLLCHTSSKSAQTTQKDQFLAGNYDYFCPAGPSCTDTDGDGYALEGGACGQVDCDDSDTAVHPGATENCTDGVDNNCNGLIDAQDPAAVGCPPVCTDADGDNFATEGGACGAVDCNDTNASVNPAVTEVCNDGLDNNCDGRIDEGCGPVCTDLDGDGFAAEGGACGQADCDDTDAAVHPAAQEICTDGIDNNCNGLIDAQDNTAINCPTLCTDSDSDGYSADGGACGPVDCNDTNAAINPGTQEVCDDNLDNDCDGAIDEGCAQTCPDADGDGYTDAACGGADCDDSDAMINPGIAETCGNSVDENCNGMADDTCISACEDGGVLRIKGATYSTRHHKLTVSGISNNDSTITLIDAGTGNILAQGVRVKRARWSVALSMDASMAPARVEVLSSAGCSSYKDVNIIGLPRTENDDDDDDDHDSDRDIRTGTREHKVSRARHND
jgi:hypothetical protein